MAITGVLVADDVTGGGVIDDLAIPVVIGIAAAYDAVRERERGPRTYVTYTLHNPTTGQVYVGRTSGFGTPDQIVQRRFSGHEKRADGYINPVVDKSAPGAQGRPAIRGREQQLMDSYGGVSSDNPKLGSKIRGVSVINPFGREYWEAANVFGNIAPYTGWF